MRPGEKLFKFLAGLILRKFYGSVTVKSEAGKVTHVETEPRRYWQYKDLPQGAADQDAQQAGVALALTHRSGRVHWEHNVRYRGCLLAGGAMMRDSSAYLKVVFWAVGVILAGTGQARAMEGTIKPGDKVEVIDGPAPLKRGTEVLAQVPTGTVLEVKKVKGKWVGVPFVKDGEKIFGWVYSTRLRPAPSQPRPPEQEAAIRQPEQAPKTPAERKDASGPKLFKQGDRVRVVVARTEVKLDGRTVGVLEEGREAVAVDVRGDLVKVEAWSDDPEDDEVPLRGWVEAKYLEWPSLAPAAVRRDAPLADEKVATPVGRIEVPYAGTQKKQQTDRRLMDKLRKYREDADMAKLRALGLAPSKGDARTMDLQVSENVSVTGVPVSSLESRIMAAIVVTAAMGLQNGTLPSSTKNDKLGDLVRWWFTDTTPFLMRALEKGKSKLSTQDLIRGDARIRDQGVQALMIFGGHAGPIDAAWLVPSDATNYGGTKRGKVRFRTLLGRFDPDQTVTAANAKMVAEELVLVRALGLGDGTWRSLPQCRTAIQAVLLEQLGFEIGDPADKEPAKREAALQRLREARAQFMRIWEDARRGK